MTTAALPRDWKVTTGYRLLLRAAWAMLGLAVLLGGAGWALGRPGAWWASAGLALAALLTVLLLPEPVPSDMITGRRTRIETRRTR